MGSNFIIDIKIGERICFADGWNLERLCNEFRGVNAIYLQHKSHNGNMQPTADCASQLLKVDVEHSFKPNGLAKGGLWTNGQNKWQKPVYDKAWVEYEPQTYTTYIANHGTMRMGNIIYKTAVALSNGFKVKVSRENLQYIPQLHDMPFFQSCEWYDSEPTDIPSIKEFAPVSLPPMDFVMEGCWFNAKMLDENLILTTFAPSDELRQQILEKFPDIANMVCCHIRRGDYMTRQWEEHFNVPPFEWYFKQAKERYSNHPILVCTDDVEWVKGQCDDVIISNGSVLFDFYVQTMCYANVCSCSTFSLMGAVLNPNRRAVVPSPYYGGLFRCRMSREWIVPTWCERANVERKKQRLLFVGNKPLADDISNIVSQFDYIVRYNKIDNWEHTHSKVDMYIPSGDLKHMMPLLSDEILSVIRGAGCYAMSRRWFNEMKSKCPRQLNALMSTDMMVLCNQWVEEQVIKTLGLDISVNKMWRYQSATRILAFLVAFMTDRYDIYCTAIDMDREYLKEEPFHNLWKEERDLLQSFIEQNKLKYIDAR